MLQSIIDLQNEAVNSLLNILKTKVDKNIYFKAPTGSGKTYMMADFMDRYLDNNPETVFLVSTLSKGDLADQSYKQFKKYKSDNIFENLNPYLITSEVNQEEGLYIPTDKNVYVLPRDLYKKNAKLMRGAMDAFLSNITLGNILKKINGKPIILIKDECHIETKNLKDISNYFSRIINFSATPKLSRGQFPDVTISEDEAVKANLIKSVKYENYSSEKDEEALDEALDIFEEEKKKYNDILGINPCMIIQISNKEKAEEEWAMIQRVLNNIKHQDLKWMLILNKDGKKDGLKCDTNDTIKAKKLPVSKWKDFAKSESSTIDIIIFKMVISEGWDIPRACMLYQIRDSKSKQLDEQVIGRVRRNPKLTTFETLQPEEQKFLMEAKVWGIKDKDKNTLIPVRLQLFPEKIQKELSIKTTVLEGLSEDKTKDVLEFFNKSQMALVPKNIFDLYKEIKNMNGEVTDFYNKNIKSLNDWYRFVDNYGDIKKQIDKLACDYTTNMKIRTDENGNEIFFSPPEKSLYLENKEYSANVRRSIWEKLEHDPYNFTFDSQAEVDWLNNLIDLTNQNSAKTLCRIIKNIEDDSGEIVYLFGKNYLAESEICYEYYLDGIHKSYPDYILKDSFDKIHLFEVKSVNIASISSINKDDYEKKVNALRNCYIYASKLTGNHFWIPIKKDNDWTIYHAYEGSEETVSYKKFVEILRTGAQHA